MAVLTDQQRFEIWKLMMTDPKFGTVAATKHEVRTLIDSLDDYIEANASAINQSIPLAIRGKFTVEQKAVALAAAALKRAAR